MGNGLGKQAFEKVYREGTQARGAFCTLRAVSGSGHVGIATKRAIGCHVRRNRARRRLQAALREVGPKPQMDAVFLVSAEMLNAPFPDLVSEVGGLFSRISETWERSSPSA